MKDYVIRRFLSALPILLGVVVLTFLMLQMLPGDPAMVMAGERATPQQIERIRHELGLDRPLPVQLGFYIVNLIQLDLGRSLLTDRPVLTEILERFPATVELTCAAMFIASVLGISLGTLAAARKNTLWDTAAMTLSLAGVSIPVFWLGLELIYFLSMRFHLFPTMGRGTALQYLTGYYLVDAVLTGDFYFLRQSIMHLVQPALTLGLLSSALIARMTRSSLVHILDQDFIKTAQAKGVPQWGKWRHAFAAGFTPIVTVMGLQMGTLLGGAILTEFVFSWPGLGSFLVQAVFARDIPSIQALVALSALIFVGINLTVDIIIAFLDPRVRSKLQNDL